MALTAEALEHYGIQMSPEEAEELLLKTLAEMVPAPPLSDPYRELTPDQIAALQSGGFALSPLPRDGLDDPLARTAALYTALLATGLTITEAAALLGVTPGRIRQLLATHAIYAIRQGRTWRLPRFQFEGPRLVPGVGEVVTQLDPELHPVEVYQWFTTPDPDLVSGDGETPLSPRDWLLSGHSPTLSK